MRAECICVRALLDSLPSTDGRELRFNLTSPSQSHEVGSRWAIAMQFLWFRLVAVHRMIACASCSLVGFSCKIGIGIATSAASSHSFQQPCCTAVAFAKCQPRHQVIRHVHRPHLPLCYSSQQSLSLVLHQRFQYHLLARSDPTNPIAGTCTLPTLASRLVQSPSAVDQLEYYLSCFAVEIASIVFDRPFQPGCTPAATVLAFAHHSSAAAFSMRSAGQQPAAAGPDRPQQ